METKICNSCQLAKPVAEFYRRSRAARGRYQSECKRCVCARTAARARVRKEENPDYYKEKAKRFRQAHPDSDRVYYLANSERLLEYFAERREKDPGYQRRWYLANQEKERAKARERMAAKRAADPAGTHAYRRQHYEQNRLRALELAMLKAAKAAGASIGLVSYTRVLERDGYYCYLCGEDIAEAVVSFDHVIPLSRGGAHTEDNIRVTHRTCNFRKGKKLPAEVGVLA